jgi:vitamin B12 transport system substrate-binding protein
MLINLDSNVLKIYIFLFVFLFSLNSFSMEIPAVKDAQRIIALSPHSVELLYALGIGDRILATTDFADYPDAAKKIERIGGYHGVLAERILELNPDLIVAWEGGNKSSDLDKLESLGLPVYRTETEKLRDISNEITMLGAMTGTQKKAKLLVDKFHQDLDRLTEENINKDKVTFFYQLWSAPIRTISVGSWINEMLTICGGTNIVNTPEVDYPQISLETVLLNEPQSIIIPSAHGHDNGELSGLKWTDWPEIPAVRNKHIYRINGDILHRFSLRVVEAIEQICSTFDKVRN